MRLGASREPYTRLHRAVTSSVQARAMQCFRVVENCPEYNRVRRTCTLLYGRAAPRAHIFKLIREPHALLRMLFLASQVYLHVSPMRLRRVDVWADLGTPLGRVGGGCCDCRSWYLR